MIDKELENIKKLRTEKTSSDLANKSEDASKSQSEDMAKENNLEKYSEAEREMFKKKKEKASIEDKDANEEIDIFDQLDPEAEDILGDLYLDEIVEEVPYSNKKMKKFGIILSIIHFLSIGVFTYALLDLGLLPILYLSIAIGVNFLIWGGILAIQLRSKKKAIISKVISILLILILAFASFYTLRVGFTLGAITGANTKVDVITVVVAADNSAESIRDTEGYTFGVQYSTDEEMIKETQDEIGDIETIEYANVGEQANALLGGEVDAIIYNTAYTKVLDDTIEDYSTKVKEVYSKKFETVIEESDEDGFDPTKDPFTIAISGIDQYGSIEATGLSDVNILAVVNPSTREVLLVNTPRDMFVELPGISDGAKDKLTHAGIYGVDASMDALAALYDTEVEFYIRLNFTSLIDIVDAVGGVEVESLYTFTTSHNSGHVTRINEGTNTLNGIEALAFSRERKNVPGGDNTRGMHQQAVITGMIEKIISPAIITGASQILSEVSGNISTNMTEDQMQSLIQDQLSKGLDFNIRSIALTGPTGSDYAYSTPGSKASVMYPDEELLEDITLQIKSVREEDFSIFQAIEIEVEQLLELAEEEE